MNRKTLSRLIVALALPVLSPAVSSVSADEPLLERDVLPILQKRCMGCHGGLFQKGGLDLRTLPAMLAGGEDGPAIVSGKPEQSELWARVFEDDMPKGGEKLPEAEKLVLRRWIELGLPTFTRRHAAAAESREAFLTADGKHAPEQVSGAIDAILERRLGASSIPPAPVADDVEFLRRVSLDLNGRVPSPDRAAAFLGDDSPDRRAKLIDALLAAGEFGGHLGRTWRDWICPPELPSDMNGGKQPHNEARALGDWFAKRFNAGDSWDRIVSDLLLVDGEIKNRPEMIFYGLVGQGSKATPDGSARSVASLFMGVQLGCAQCHDDPYRDWAQREFWSLAAFFGGVKGSFKKLEESEIEGRITIPKSAFRNSGDTIPVAFLGARASEGSSDDTPAPGKARWRPRLVDWLTAPENPFFARAFVNRVWFSLFARGLVNPVDDFRELNPPSHPELVELLAREFVASGFDVKHLFRSICGTRAYQRTSRVASSKRDGDRPLDDAALEEQLALFGRAPVRVMTADMLLESLKLAYGDPKLDLRGFDKEDGNASGESAPVGDPYLEFQRCFGTNEEDPTDFTHGIPQMLTFINHPRLLEGSRAFEDFRKSNEKAEPGELTERLYLSTLSRKPSSEELEEALDYIAAAGDAGDSYKDVLWMLVNRSEFICVR